MAKKGRSLAIRRPSAAAEEFVAQASDSERSEEPAATEKPERSPTTPSVSRRGFIERKKGEQRRLLVYMPSDLGQALDVEAARLGRTKSDVVSEAIAEWLERRQTS